MLTAVGWVEGGEIPPLRCFLPPDTQHFEICLSLPFVGIQADKVILFKYLFRSHPNMKFPSRYPRFAFFAKWERNPLGNKNTPGIPGVFNINRLKPMD
jgi:hypothetical protein